MLGGSGNLYERLTQHDGDHGQRWLHVAVRSLFWETAAGQHPRVHATRVPPRSTCQPVGAQGGEVLLPQQRTEPPAGLVQGPHVIRPNKRHAGRHLGDGARADHRGWAGHGDGCRTGGVGGRLARQVRAANAVDAAGATGNAGDGNGTICDDAGNDAGAADGGAAARGDVAVIPTGNRKPLD